MNIIISTVMCIAVLHIINILGKGKDKLPGKPLFSLFMMGAAAAVIIVVFSIVTGGNAEILTGLGLSGTSAVYMLLDDFLLTALVEEGLKYIALRTYTGKRDLVKCRHHMITAAAAVAAGFTAAENILYLFADAGLILRLVFGISGHFTYAIFMGDLIASANETDDPALKKKYLRRSLLIPLLMHGAYDFSCSLLQTDMDSFLYLLVLLVIVIVYIRFYIIAAIRKLKAAVSQPCSAEAATEVPADAVQPDTGDRD